MTPTGRALLPPRADTTRGDLVGCMAHGENTVHYRHMCTSATKHFTFVNKKDRPACKCNRHYRQRVDGEPSRVLGVRCTVCSVRPNHLYNEQNEASSDQKEGRRESRVFRWGRRAEVTGFGAAVR